MSNATRAFTGRRRKRTTSLRVKAVDIISQSVITVGGIGTIFAVMLVFIFLLWTAMPLFSAAEADPEFAYSAEATNDAPMHVGIDEYLTLGWAAYRDGRVETFRLDTGKVLATQVLPEAEAITAWSFASDSGDVSLGYRDGTVRTGTITFETVFLNEPGDFMESGDDPDRHLPGDLWEYRSGIVELTPERQFRLRTVALEFDDPLDV
ncbi:MAG: hypothetical protein ACOC0P_02840, partial [Planctomycetota bacterium]